MCAESVKRQRTQHSEAMSGWDYYVGGTALTHLQGNRGDSHRVCFPSGFNQVARPKESLKSFPWQIWKKLVLPSSWLHAASDRRAGITGGHSWQPIHFADSSIRGVALSQSLASRLKAESCKAAGTWRNAGKLLPFEGQQWKVDCYLFPLLSDPNSKCAQINSLSVVRELFVTFVHGIESEIIGNSWTLLNRSSWLLYDLIITFAFMGNIDSGLLFYLVVQIKYERGIIADVIPFGHTCKMNLPDKGIKLKKENPGSAHLPTVSTE